MYLPVEKAEMVLRLLLEGNSVSSVERATSAHHSTILKLLVLAGEKCERIMATKIRNVQVRDVECDDFGPTSEKNKSGSGPRTINSSATATFSLQLNATPSWFLTSPWAAATRAPRTPSLKACATRQHGLRSRSPPMDSRLTGRRSPQRCTTGSPASHNSSRSIALRKKAKLGTRR